MAARRSGAGGGFPVSNQGDNLPAAIRELIGAKVGLWLRRTRWGEQEREDLEQELTAEYLRRSAKLDPERAAAAADASVMLDRCLASLRRRRRAQKRSACRTHHLADSARGPAALQDRRARDARCGTKTRSDQEQAELASDIADVLRRLSARQRKLARLLMCNSKCQAARRRRVPRSTQHGEVLEIRALFERAGLRDYL